MVRAVEKGARQQFDDLGIKVVASTSADFDPAKQANNVESVLALNPDVIVTIAVDRPQDPARPATSSERGRAIRIERPSVV